jgi:hypothetical protein
MRRSADRRSELGDCLLRNQAEKPRLIRPRRVEHEVAESQIDVGPHSLHLLACRSSGLPPVSTIDSFKRPKRSLKPGYLMPIG